MQQDVQGLRSYLRPGQRVLFKLSGEALAGDSGTSFCPQFLKNLVDQLHFLRTQDLEIGMVVGGGNFFRGRQALDTLSRTTADHMGMLATLLNGLALRDVFEDAGIPTTAMSALPVSGVVDPVCVVQAKVALRQKHLVLFVGGTGNPYFTTDTGAVLRAIEMECDVLLKGTQVDGVYSADPKQSPEAEFFPHIRYHTVLERNLAVMDLTAVALAKENQLPMAVFCLQSHQALQDVWQGQTRFTWVS